MQSPSKFDGYANLSEEGYAGPSARAATLPVPSKPVNGSSSAAKRGAAKRGASERKPLPPAIESGEVMYAAVVKQPKKREKTISPPPGTPVRII